MEDRTIFNENGEKAVLLFHAYTSTPNDMLSLAREFERQNFTVYAPTFTGHGQDDPDEVLKYGIEDWVKDGERAYQELVEKGYTEIYPFGLSLGGIVALNLIIKHQPKHGGIFSSPTMAYPDHNLPENFFRWYRMMKNKLGDSKEDIDQMVKNQESRLDQVINELWSHTKEQLMPKYDTIEGRMFVGQAGDDEMIDPAQAEAFVDELTSSKEVVYKYYEGAAHAITTGRIGRELRTDVLNFLSEEI